LYNVTYLPSHRQVCAPMINIQPTLPTTPDLYKNVSLAVKFGNNSSSYTLCMQSDICTYSSQYTDAGRTKEIKICNNREFRLPKKSSACYFGHVCRKIGSPDLVRQSLLIIEALPSYSDTQHSVGLLWTSDRLDAEISIWQHTTRKWDRLPWPRRNLNPQS
jgi:hypothetical protein